MAVQNITTEFVKVFDSLTTVNYNVNLSDGSKKEIVSPILNDTSNLNKKLTEVIDHIIISLGLFSSRKIGFDDFDIKLSTRPETRVGSDEVWDKAEAALENAITKLDLPFEVVPGEGAFYGPKLDFVLTDAIGREWQCGTFQADFNLPDRLDAEYVGEDGAKHKPVMIHRAVLGSFERFIGILIENYSGKLPLWLAPNQVAIATIISDADDYAVEIAESLKENGIRVINDLRNEKIGYKVREHSAAKVPLILALGAREKESRTVSVRRIGSNNTETLSLEEFLEHIKEESKSPSFS